MWAAKLDTVGEALEMLSGGLQTSLQADLLVQCVLLGKKGAGVEDLLAVKPVLLNCRRSALSSARTEAPMMPEDAIVTE